MTEQSKIQLIAGQLAERIAIVPNWLEEYLRTKSIFKIAVDFDPNKENPHDFYVYALIDPRNGEIFYIGKGKGRRAWHHLLLRRDDRNREKQNRIKEIYLASERPIVWILDEGLEQTDAYDWEAYFINKLPNLTNVHIHQRAEPTLIIYERSQPLDATPAEVQCTFDSMTEFLNELKKIVATGTKVTDEGHLYRYRGQLHDVGNFIHFLPKELRTQKAAWHR